LENFKKAEAIKPENTDFNAELAVTHHAIGHVDEAIALWKKAVEQTPKCADIDWLRDEQQWPEELINEAQKLIAIT
jgi:tetratricopeptide (TPR) repeat protein